MSKNDFIRELASMVLASHEEQDSHRGYWLSRYWLTPETCHYLAKLIEEVNNEDFGEGNWKIDKPAINALKRGTSPLY